MATTIFTLGGITYSVYEVPTTPQSQEFDVSLGGTTYHLVLTWNPAAQCWNLDVEDSQQNPLVQGLQLITGADLLEQFAYLGIGGSFQVQSDFDVTEVPGYGALGSTGHLFFISPQVPSP